MCDFVTHIDKLAACDYRPSSTIFKFYSMNTTMKHLREFVVSLLVFTVFMGNIAKAQSHFTKCVMCKYNKNYVPNAKYGTEAPCACAACAKENEKERQAKIAENKRRQDVVIAKKKAEKEARDKAFAEEQRKKQQEAKSGEVVINNTPSKPTNNSKVKQEKKNISIQKGIMYSNFSHSMYNLSRVYGGEGIRDYFILNGNPVLQGKFRACFSLASDAENNQKFPENIGIAALKKTKKTNFGDAKEATTICDLVNESGERLLKDDEITFIIHFYGEWFVLFKNGWSKSYTRNPVTFEDADFYNFKTKERIPLKRNTDNNHYVEDIEYNVEYEKPHSDWKNNYRATGAFKAALQTRLSVRSAIIYYLNNDNKIEYDIYSW